MSGLKQQAKKEQIVEPQKGEGRTNETHSLAKTVEQIGRISKELSFLYGEG